MKPKLMFSMYGVTSAMSAKCSLLHDAKKREWVPKTAANKKIVAAFIAKPSVGFIIIGTTGCSCCRNENFVDGLFDTIEQAKSKAQNHTERRTVRSQYSDTGIYEIRRIEYLQLPDERIVIGSRVFDDRYFFETGEDISWSMQYEGTAAA